MKMIRRLRFRMITVSMLALAIVLAVIIGAANIMNYRQMVTEADEITALLAENGGSFPEAGSFARLNDAAGKHAPKNNGTLTVPDGGNTGSESSPEGGMNKSSGSPGRRYGRGNTFSAETPFESRFFTVTVNNEGTCTGTGLDKIASVDSSTAEAYAEAVLSAGKERGFIDSYRYLVDERTDDILVIFLDRSRSLATVKRFLFTSIIIALGGLLAVFLLILLFSGRIIRPFVDNYEKQRRFITDAGHELKTPLAIINADAEVLEMEQEDGENEWIADIRKQTARLSELTAELIALSRMEEDSAASFIMADFPVSEMAAEAADSYNGPALSRGFDFTTDIRPSLMLHGDERAVGQLIGILMDNALKYTNEGGSIKFSLTRAGKYIRLAVFNTCDSIDRASLPHLFDRFYRTDSSRNSGTGGYGIGLSIAQAIVSAHKGKISAETSDGHSLTVTALFPLK